ncbi:hypothetical protein DFH09DRAFT_1094337 [Mycena vulgaris]|nr:hypothetical protein DFH09DRAFT_1094337 [Mycena vulgaris]
MPSVISKSSPLSPRTTLEELSISTDMDPEYKTNCYKSVISRFGIFKRFPDLQLPLFVALRFMKLGFMLRDWSPMADLDAVLSSLPSCTPMIELVVLNVYSPSGLPAVGDHCSIPHPLFDSARELRQGLPHLAGLEVRWYHPMEYNSGTDPLSAYMKQKFPGAEEAGILGFPAVFERDSAIRRLILE